MITISKNSMTSKERKLLNVLVRAEVDKTVKRIHWILLLAVVDEFQLGKTRIARLLKQYETYLDDYDGYNRNDDNSGDDILLLRIRQRGLADIYQL